MASLEPINLMATQRLAAAAAPKAGALGSRRSSPPPSRCSLRQEAAQRSAKGLGRAAQDCREVHEKQHQPA